MTEDEINAVAQAITDAHASKPSMDCSGRIDDAKTIIAAVDALVKFRNPVAVTDGIGPAPAVGSIEAITFTASTIADGVVTMAASAPEPHASEPSEPETETAKPPKKGRRG